MKTVSEMAAALAAPFPPDAISWRVGSMTKDKTKARALAYLDSRDVMRRFDEVCGAFGWQCEYVPMHDGTCCCRIGVLSPDVSWIWKGNGAGATDIEGDKGKFSDAMKRAAVLWGVGQYLYDIDSPWVKLDEWKQIEKDELPKLRALLERKAGNAPAAVPKSAYAARKDGHYPECEKRIRACETLTDLVDVWKQLQPYIKEMPAGWQKSISEEKDRKKEALMAEHREAAE